MEGAHQQINRKRPYGAPDGPASTSSTESDVPFTEDNPFRIPNAPPYKVIVPSGYTFQSMVHQEDIETLGRMAGVVLYCYRLAKTMPIYLAFDTVDQSYQMTFSLPFDVSIELNMLTSIYRVNPMLVTQKSWAQVSQMPDALSGEIVTTQNVNIGVASYKRSHVVVTDVCLMQYESEATQRSPEDFDVVDVRRVDTAPVAPSSSSSSSSGVHGNNNNNKKTALNPEPSPLGLSNHVLPPATPTNELQIPNVTQPYRIIVPPRMTFADVVAVPDLDMLRKIAQVVFYLYTTPKTINIFVSYDVNDHVYEVTFSCQMDARVSQDFLSCIYCICPMLITRKPCIKAARGPSPTTGEILITQNITLRYASYRRSYLTIPETSLLMWMNQCTYVPSEEEADIVRPLKRVSNLQFGKGDNTPAGPGAVGKR